MELSYSFHLGNDKNKSIKARQQARNTLSGTTTKSNNAIQNVRQLGKVNHHNLRQYDNNGELIKTIKGSNDITKDVKELYLELFDKSRIEYNNKQVRDDRKIDNYFNKISDDDKHDLACEIVIELGDMNYWDDKTMEYKYEMVKVFESQIKDLKEIVPDFYIANATIHFDESSPHIHIVGVPVKEDCKTGLSRQVGKTSIFTKESLVVIQDKMRERCIEEFNKVYGLDTVNDNIRMYNFVHFYIAFFVHSYIIINIADHLSEESIRLDYLKDKIMVPEKIFYEKYNGKSYIMTKSLDGEMLCSEHFINNPDEGIKILVEVFNYLYNIDYSDCIIDETIDTKLNRVEKRLNNINESTIKKEILERFHTKENIFKFLKGNKPKQLIGFTHGDMSLPNIYASNGHFSGLLDVDECGISDIYFDLVICEKSIERNYGKEYINKFYDALGIEKDEFKSDYYRIMMEL